MTGSLRLGGAVRRVHAVRRLTLYVFTYVSLGAGLGDRRTHSIYTLAMMARHSQKYLIGGFSFRVSFGPGTAEKECIACLPAP